MLGRTAEGRSELVELADDSASSADVTIPSSPRGAGSMTERTGVPLYTSSREAVEQLEHEMQDSRKDSRVHTRIDTDLGHAEERRETEGPNRELRDQEERRKTTTEYWPC